VPGASASGARAATRPESHNTEVPFGARVLLAAVPVAVARRCGLRRRRRVQLADDGQHGAPPEHSVPPQEIRSLKRSGRKPGLK
jgi:hypothetical protein